MSPKPSIDPATSATEAGLRYVSDTDPGITRRRAGQGFSYIDVDGNVIHDEKILERLHNLVIPPAWEEVWICPHPKGHLQATGVDDKGRKQYLYHPKWRTIRDATKYHRMMAFGKLLPKIRQQVKTDLAKPGLPKEKVVATVVALLEKTMIRVGNEEYAKENKSYGLTTLRDRHVDITGQTINFRFRGKSGKEHDIDLSDRKLARVIEQLQELPGQQLFQYTDEADERHDVTSTDVNEYLQAITGEDFTAKDFRTWKGTVLACMALQACDACTSVEEAKKNIVAVVKEVAEHLGNTPAISRKSYIHPSLFERYAADLTFDCVKKFTPQQLSKFKELQEDEALMMAFLESSQE